MASSSQSYVPFAVALTGGVASGKSAVSDRFAALGAGVIDTDIVSRELVMPGQPALSEIVTRFGQGILAEDGSLNRRALRERVFADPVSRRQLEAILHPRIRDVVKARAASLIGTYALLVIPLLVESGDYDWVDRVLVVDVPRDVQTARLLARDGVTPELAEAMLDAQASRNQRLAMADDVIVNDGPLSALDAQVRELHDRYLARARSDEFRHRNE